MSMTPSPDFTNKYPARGPQELRALIQGHPLAWLSSAGHATALPLLPRFDERSGALVAIEGHIARANPQVDALRAAPEAQLLWMGPQGYVSPSWMADRTQAPSWNYASARCTVRVQFIDDDGSALLRHLGELADRFEAGRPQRWQIAEMGPRLPLLAARIVAFRADVLALDERYKLGQDERDDVYADILRGLAGEPGAGPLIDWMRRMNPNR